MKFLKLVLVHVPDQVLSTMIIWACIFFWYRGILSIINELPSATTVLVVILIGIALGVLTAARAALPHEKDIETPKVDR